VQNHQWHLPIIEGNIKGTLISPANVIAYQIGWGNLVFNRYTKGLTNEKFEMPLEGFKWNELGSLATHFHSVYQDRVPNVLLRQYKDFVQEILALINSLTNSLLYEVGIYPWTGRYTLGRYIQLNTSAHYKNASAKIRKFLKEAA
jgi:hypothetical protein